MSVVLFSVLIMISRCVFPVFLVTLCPFSSFSLYLVSVVVQLYPWLKYLTP